MSTEAEETSASPQEDEFDSRVALGKRLKELRKRKLLTITQLSLYTGLSVGYLSNVERGQTSPTVSNLTLICRELGVSPVDVLAERESGRDLIRAADAPERTIAECGMSIKVVDFGVGFDAYDVITIEPGDFKVDAPAMHPYPESCFVVSGELTVTLEGEDVVLSEGDALCIRANHRHTIRNSGDVPSVTVWYRMRHQMVTSLV